MHGRFVTERLSVEPWNNALSHPNSREALLSELQTLLDAEMTAFLPESLRFHKGETDVEKWARTFSEGADVSSVKLLTGFQELAGLLLLRPDGGTAGGGDVLHVGYIFGKPFWGHGLATELVRGLVTNLASNKYTGTLKAGVAKGNPASVAVLKKVGFRPLESKEGAPPDTDFFCRTFPL